MPSRCRRGGKGVLFARESRLEVREVGGYVTPHTRCLRESALRVAQKQVLKQNGVGVCKVMLSRSLLCGRVCRGVEVCREGHAEASWRNLGNASGNVCKEHALSFFFYYVLSCVMK